MPVIFLPNDGTDDKDCDATDDSKMSSFGFMSFAIAVVNAVINNANNVNNNNNNNNINDVSNYFDFDHSLDEKQKELLNQLLKSLMNNAIKSQKELKDAEP